MINFCLSEKEKRSLKSLIGESLLKIRHDPFDRFGQETVYGRVELFFEKGIVLIGYDYAPYPLFGGDDDHPKFYVECIDEHDAVSALRETEQINVDCNKIVSGITLVEDAVEVEWDDKKDEARYLKAIIFKFGKDEIAIQGDYMIPLLDIVKGEDVASKLADPGEEFANDPETKCKARRTFVDILL